MFPSHRALPHQICSCCLIALCPNPSSFSLFLISATCCCGPCGVVGDAPASSKRSGKSTGLWGKPGYQAKHASRRRYGLCVPGAASRRPLGMHGSFTPAPVRVQGMLAFHCKSLRNVSQAALAQAGIIRLRHGAPRRLFPATLVPCLRRSPDSIFLLRQSQSQAPSSGSRKPVAARLLAATP